MVKPVRGDVLAGISVALVLVPQSLAYAEIAGVDPVHGLYAAVAAPIAGAFVGSSPYLQTGPVAVTSLLTFGALSAIGDPFTARFALLAGVLAILVGLARLLIGLVGGGPIAYLMSQPVVVSFTAAAAVLIISSQVPSLLGAEGGSGNPVVSALEALASPADWSLVDLVLGAGAIVVMLGGRRLSPLFPGALLAVVAATLWSWATDYDGSVVGRIEVELALPSDVPWADLPNLLVPALVIAIVGFAEPSAIARRYAAEDRTYWDSNREFMGQGLANIASGVAGGYPVGGSFSRTALNRLGGARTRWSGAITGLSVAAILPFAFVLAPLPTAVLAGLVIAAVSSLIDVRSPGLYWRWSRPQFVVGVVTVVGTLILAPRVEQGVLLGVGTALAVHLWRELQVGVPSRLDEDTLHVWPTGVLYFGSAPGVERAVSQLVAEHEEVRRIVVHLGRLGRVDLTGALMLRDLLEEVRSSGIEVELTGAKGHAARILARVLGDESLLK
ncbi:MAG TPA: SulP family inorganic anion transporter [Nocardioidaceae bacterium]|nr:SulP family inorganic anion transporter [Nocardioidaceae bacterium]